MPFPINKKNLPNEVLDPDIADISPLGTTTTLVVVTADVDPVEDVITANVVAVVAVVTVEVG